MPKTFHAVLLSALVAGSGASAMTYGQVPFQDGSVAFVAQGRIEHNELQMFAQALQVARAQGVLPGTLIIASPGGNMGGAIGLGLALRKLGMRTLVGSLVHAPDGQRALSAAACDSACVMVLMGGVDRSVVPGSRVGVHAPKLNLDVDEGTSRAVLSRAEPLLREYTRLMGVSPDVIGIAKGVPSTTIRALTSAELSRFQLVTGGSGKGQARKAHGRRAVAPRPKRQAS